MKIWHDIFREVVGKYKTKTAIVYEDKRMNYAELDALSDQIAGSLRAKEIGRENIVAVMLERSVEYAAVILGIWKAGAAYVCIDLSYPRERIDFMLKDGNVKVIINQEYLANLNHMQLADLPTDIKPDDLAAVIYTSGSTGNPKGVMLEHKSIAATYHDLGDARFGCADDVFLINASTTFVAFLFSVILALGRGMEAHVSADSVRKDINELKNYIEQNGITMTFATPQLGQFLTVDHSPLKTLLIGGDKAVAFDSKHVQVINMLGLSEVNGAVTNYFCLNSVQENTPIGTPMRSVKLYLLDDQLNPVEKGEQGEICIAGPKVARGYLHNPAITAQKFIHNPFSTHEDDKILFLTGDIGRELADGNIEYVNRNDWMVNINGFRVEPGEIENRIKKIPAIKNAVVKGFIDQDKQHYLCAFYTVQSGITEDEIKTYIAEFLPDYMIPAFFTELAEIPLNSNGKVDRKSLKAPELSRTLKAEYLAPNDEREAALCKAFEQILGIEPVGINDDFFMLGGDSIKAMKLQLLCSRLGVTMTQIMQEKTPAKLAKLVEENVAEEGAIAAFAKRDYYPLTENQLGIYYEWEKDNEALQYNLPEIIKFSNKVAPLKLKAAIKKIFAAHPYLKTCLGKEDGQVVQLRKDDEPVCIELAKASEAEIINIKESFVKPFDLFSGPLYRIIICSTEIHTYLFMDIHHIIVDGSTLGVFHADLAKAYRGEELSKEIYTAFDHALEEEQMVGSEKYLKAKEFFDHKLKDNMTELPRMAKGGRQGQAKFASINIQGTEIKKFCQENAVTPSNLFLSAFCYTLHRYTQEEKIAITTISSGRNKHKLMNITGMFVKTVPVIVPILRAQNALELIKAVQADMLETIENEIYPLTKMAESYKFVPQINYVYQGGMLEPFELEGQWVEIEVLEVDKVKLPLALSVFPKHGGYEISFEYDESLYTDDYIDKLSCAIAECARQMADNPQSSLKDIGIVNAEQQALLASFNPAADEYAERTLQEIFEDTVNINREKTALIAGDQTLSYAALNAAANRIANALFAEGVKPEDKIAFLLPRDSRLICTIFGIIKAGGAFIPVDPEYPAERIKHVLEDSEAKYIITTRQTQAELGFGNGLTVDALLQHPDEENPVTELKANNLCYIIYTSGSTGKPKGVMIEHRNIANYVLPLPTNFYINKILSVCSTMLSVTTVAFDVFLEEAFVTLANGLTLVFADEDRANNPLLLADFMTANGVDVLSTTPSRIMQYAEASEFAGALANVKFIICGGEKFPANFFTALRKYTDALIYNTYGPTETTIATNAKELENEQITIGKPLSNVKLYVVDTNLQMLPVGVVGELLIGGKGVGRGYLNRPELTEEKFILFNGERVYRSGDYAKWTADGEIDIIGRMDNQIKLRGLRIELGEIEARMSEYAGITASVVTIKQLQNADYLCAYFTAKGKIDAGALREYLAKHLTAYMIPSTFTQLEKMPVTPNGKTDVKALPAPVLERRESVPPQNEMQRQIFMLAAGILGTEEFGITDDLFSVGLTSILAIKLSVAIHKQFNINIKTKDIMKHKTIEMLEAVISSTAEEEEAQAFAKQAYYPLTENQLGLYYEWEKNQQALQYNIPKVLKLSSKIDPGRLKSAVVKVIEAHPYLKTYLGREDGQVVQLRKDDDPVVIELAEVSEAEVQSIKDAFVRPFDLFKGPLYRIAVYYTKQNTYLFIDIHHIIIDGSALGVFADDLVKAFRGEELVGESYTAFDHALAEEQMAGSDKYLAAENYFDGKLGDSMTELPKAAKGTGEGQAKIVRVNVYGQSIEKFCKEHAVTPSNLFLSALCATLKCYTREEKIAIAAISSGRNETQLAGIMGMFVKTLPVVVGIHPDEKAADYVKTVQENMFETMENEMYPFTKMVEKHQIVPRICYVYQGGMLERLEIAEQTVEVEDLALNKAKFPVAVAVNPKHDSYEISVEYDDSLYTDDYIRTLGRAIGECANQIAENPAICCGKLAIISQADKEKVLHKFQGGIIEYDKNATFMDFFLKQVERTAENIALVDAFSSLTYKQTNEYANCIARELVRLGVKENTFVGIMLPRCKEFMVSVIGTMKAGGAYVPLDNAYPRERIAYMLQDSGATVLITEKRLYEQKGLHAENVIFIDEFDFSAGNNEEIKLNAATAENLAYMIYTSGSTGKPKGVMIRHKSLAAFLAWRSKDYQLTEHDNLCCHCSFSFDASVYDLFAPLTVGGQLHIIGEDMRQNMQELNQYLHDHHITDGTFSTQFGMELLNQFDVPLKSITLGGEKFKAVRKADVKVINAYGPTEFTICSSYQVVDQDKKLDNIPIGKPVANSWAYVVDNDNKLMPVGVAGELCLAGVQIALGYWNREDLTQERFVDNPFHTCAENAKMYRTGDLVCWNENGELEYSGRIDNQVKLRGFRIELGEIESAMARFAGITASVAEIKAIGKSQHLCGYFTANNTINTEKLRKHLGTSLTDYMVPAFLMQLDRLPLTPNGKVDRKALPDPVMESREPVRPKNGMQQQIFDLVANVLGTAEFGIDDNLFSIGMTSIMAIKVSAGIYNQFNVNIKTNDIIKNPTIEKLEEIMQSTSADAGIETFVKRASYPLTENQLALYYEWEKDREALQYNIPYVLRFTKKVAADKLRSAVLKVFAAHPYLKTYLGREDGRVVQLRKDDAPVVIALAKVNEAQMQNIKDAFVQPFDLFAGPLYRIAVYYTETHTYLFMDIHHIIMDGSSLGQFTDEVIKAYQGRELSRESYTAFDHALEEIQMAGSDRYLAAEKFFDHKLHVSMTELPKVAKGGYEGQTKLVAVNVQRGEIEKFCKENAVTPSNLFLSAFCYMLHRYTMEEKIAITVISSGRNENKLNNIMGMFVKTLPVVVPVDSREQVAAGVKAVQENMFETMAYEFYPFTKMVEKHKIVPLVNYSYEGGMIEALELEGEAVEAEGLALNKAKFPLAVSVTSNNENFEISVEYDDSLYTDDYIRTLSCAIAECARQMADNPQSSFKDIGIVNAEQQALLASFNPATDEYADRTLQQIFEDTVKINCEKPALITSDQTFSYAALNAAANRIANALIAKGVKPEDKIAFLLPRDSRLICTIFGIVKAGGAFIPVDPEYPAERIKHVLEDSEAKYIITTRQTQAELGFGNGLTVDALLQHPDEENPLTELKANNLCYIIYTSGSTGKPKGVMIEHHNIANYVLPLPTNFYINKILSVCSTMLSVTTVAFDVFLEEAFVTLANGLTLVFADEDRANNPLLLADFMTTNGVDVLSTTPSRIMQYAEAPEFAGALANVKFIICGGEKFPANFFTALRKYTDALIYNTYGPTETTIATNAKELENEQITIGKPLSNVKLYVVDTDLQMLPIGVVGELLIGGKGVGRGYLNRPELTAEKFIIFNGERVYRSGDYAKWTADGEIDIIGRMDNQIKLRGLRIELGEIEARMSEYVGIAASVVTIKRLQNADYLCAYFTAKSKIDVGALREYLKKHLTAYMVPTAFTQLAKMPVTPNGKTDIKALPDPEIKNYNAYVAPRNELEEKLCNIFAETLKLDKVGITDNFFDLGGTSLQAMNVVIKAMGMDIGITYANVFKFQSPQQLAEFLNAQVVEEETGTDLGAYNYSFIHKLLGQNTLGEITETSLGDILLTGATGFLGIHILREFVENYPGKVYCLMRSKDSNADARLKVRLVYYFEHDYHELFGSRIFTVAGDINEPESLNAVKVDTVINCAALVKHFAAGDELEKVNVGGVQNLINYCQAQNALLIQVSTTSIAGTGDADAKDVKINESQLYLGQEVNNKYILSKFLAERCVLEAIGKGLKAKVMRVGNLMPRNTDGEFQINFTGNSFMNSLKSFKLLGKFPVNFMGGAAEFSPIDSTAKAILKLAQTNSEYTVFHPCNNHAIYMSDIIYAMREYGFAIDIVHEREFAKCLKEKMQDDKIMPALTGILAYQESNPEKPMYALGQQNEFTTEVLYRLNFKWPLTSEVYINKAIKALDGLGFFDADLLI